MIIACPACSTRYVVPDSAIGVDGRTVRCAKCRHSWFLDGPEPELAAAPAQVAQGDDRRIADAPPPVAESFAASAAPAAPEPAFAEPVSRAAEASTPGRMDDEASVAPAAQPDTAIPDTFSVPETVRAGAEEDARPTVYDDTDTPSWGRAAEDHSTFAYSPPVRPRRNTSRLLMIAAAIFAVIVLGATAWVWRFGLPGWVPVTSTTFAEAQPELVLDFPTNRQARRTLPNGTEFFEANGTVTNVGASDRPVPSILIVMRDSRERIVYSWEVLPPKRRLAPGESVNINEAVTDVPKSAVAAEIGWKPG